MTHRVPKTVLFGLVITSILLLGACEQGPGTRGPEGPQGDRGPPGPPGTGQPFNWADVLSEHRISEAVYAIGIYLPDGSSFVIGTGFAAYYTNAIWTNAHVAIGLRDALAPIAHLRPIPFAVRSGTRIGSEGTYVLTGYDIHPRYDGTAFSPDVAAIYLVGDLPVFLDLLPRQYATQLAVGEPVATMGFPGELDFLYSAAPTATFKDGTISALRPLLPTDANTSPSNLAFVQHNLDLSPGTSGSPIIDHAGWVIAVNNAGTSKIAFDPVTGQPTRVPSGNIGWGIRVDEVWGLIDVFESAGKQVVASRRTPLDGYQAFPENWDGTTVAP